MPSSILNYCSKPGVQIHIWIWYISYTPKTITMGWLKGEHTWKKIWKLPGCWLLDVCLKLAAQACAQSAQSIAHTHMCTCAHTQCLCNIGPLHLWTCLQHRHCRYVWAACEVPAVPPATVPTAACRACRGATCAQQGGSQDSNLHAQWACTPSQAHPAQALNMAIMQFSIWWVPHVLNYGSLFYNVICFCFGGDLVVFMISGSCVSGW